jgi:hypothetical protein
MRQLVKQVGRLILGVDTELGNLVFGLQVGHA